MGQSAMYPDGPDPDRCIEAQYVRADVIARLFGVTTRRIQQLTQDGALKTTATGEGRRYDLEETVKAYIRYLSEKAYKKSANKKESELKNQKLEAEVALKESQAELHRIKTEIATGDYISREEVTVDYQRFFVTFKRFALSIPSRLVGMVSDQIRPTEARRVETELIEEVKRMLTAFSVAGTAPPDDAEEPAKAKKKAAGGRNARKKAAPAD